MISQARLGHTVEPALTQIERVAGYRPDKAITDRGYRGRKQYGPTERLLPGKPAADATDYARRKMRRRFRRRAAIEPKIGHLRSDFRLGRNFLHGIQGDALNLLLAATAANLSLWLRRASACLHAILARLPFALGLRALPTRPLVQTGFQGTTS